VEPASRLRERRFSGRPGGFGWFNALSALQGRDCQPARLPNESCLSLHPPDIFWVPGSVFPHRCRGGSSGHPSTNAVAGALQRPTRALGRAALKRALSGLAPGGVYLAFPVTREAGGLLHHRFTLTCIVPLSNRREAGGLFSVALACVETSSKASEDRVNKDTLPLTALGSIAKSSTEDFRPDTA
jgi:hypothetical protein